MLAIFDLDDTLIAGDSSQLFAEYLVRHGLASADTLLEQNARFMRDYHSGSLDLEAYMCCNLAPVRGWTRAAFYAFLEPFIQEVIRPRVLTRGVERIRWHRERHHDVLVISATGDHLVKPIARALGIEDALGVEVLWRDDRLTGDIGALRPFQGGKIDALGEWRGERGTGPEAVWFYSDSHNDLPLLSYADVPVAVNPDPVLSAHAAAEGWMVLRDEVAVT